MMLVGSSSASLLRPCCLRSLVGAKRLAGSLMVVQLTTDVAGLGLRDDQVIVKAGRMRQDLFPSGLALYTNKGKVIPNTPFGTVLPPSSKLRANALDLARRRSLRAGDPYDLLRSEPEQLPALPSAEAEASSSKPRGPTEQELENKRVLALEREDELAALLRRVGTLVFHRKVADTDLGTLYGSVTVDEVLKLLGEKHSVVVERDRAAFQATGSSAGDEAAASRVRTLGRHAMLVRLPTRGSEVSVRIDVKAEAI